MAFKKDYQIELPSGEIVRIRYNSAYDLAKLGVIPLATITKFINRVSTEDMAPISDEELADTLKINWELVKSAIVEPKLTDDDYSSVSDTDKAFIVNCAIGNLSLKRLEERYLKGDKSSVPEEPEGTALAEFRE